MKESADRRNLEALVVTTSACRPCGSAKLPVPLGSNLLRPGRRDRFLPVSTPDGKCPVARRQPRQTRSAGVSCFWSMLRQGAGGSPATIGFWLARNSFAGLPSLPHISVCRCSHCANPLPLRLCPIRQALPLPVPVRPVSPRRRIRWMP